MATVMTDYETTYLNGCLMSVEIMLKHLSQHMS